MHVYHYESVSVRNYCWKQLSAAARRRDCAINTKKLKRPEKFRIVAWKDGGGLSLNTGAQTHSLWFSYDCPGPDKRDNNSRVMSNNKTITQT